MNILKHKSLFFVPVALFVLVLTIYLLATSTYQPFYSYHHHVFQAESFLSGRFDVINIPDYYHDVTVRDGKTYLPFGPTPAFVLMPAVFVWGRDTNPQYVGAVVGALNVLLTFALLRKLNRSLFTSLVCCLFVAFGSVHFYSVYIGSTWYLAQVIGMFLLLASLNLVLLSHPPLFTIGILLGLGVLTRVPLLLSLPFFIGLVIPTKALVLSMSKERDLPHNIGRRFLDFARNDIKKMALLLSGLSIPFLFQFWFNYVRFGSILQDGHQLVFNNYKDFPIPITIAQYYFPGFPLFNFLDIRNIPLHIYTAFLLLPTFKNTFPYLEFLPFGTSILFTSPLLLLIPWARWGDKIVRLSALAGFLVMGAVFLHFTQGWVQFSYRFLLDFLPFVIIILSSAIEHVNKKLVLVLLAISVFFNIWGILYGAK